MKKDIDEKLYDYILTVAKQQYRDDYEDIAHEAYLLALQRKYFDKRMLKEAARNLDVFNVSYTEKHTILLSRNTKHACEKQSQTTTVNKELDERITNILANTRDSRVVATIRDILTNHENIVTACMKNNISYNYFVNECRVSAEQLALL